MRYPSVPPGRAAGGEGAQPGGVARQSFGCGGRGLRSAVPRGQPRHRAASALVRGRCPSPPPPREPLGAARGSRASPRRGACGGGVSPPPRRPRASLPLPTPPLQLGRAPCPRDGVSPSPAARAGSQRGGAARGMLRRLRGGPSGAQGAASASSPGSAPAASAPGPGALVHAQRCPLSPCAVPLPRPGSEFQWLWGAQEGQVAVHRLIWRFLSSPTQLF